MGDDPPSEGWSDAREGVDLALGGVIEIDRAARPLLRRVDPCPEPSFRR